MRGTSLLPRIVAALASSLTYYIFCSLVSIETPLLPILAGLSAASPGLSPLSTSLVISASLYLGGNFKLLLLFSPLLLLVVYKGIQSWHSALFVQLLSVLVLISGDYAAAFLGLLYAISSIEEPRASLATGLVFVSYVFVMSGFLLPNDVWLCGMIKVPGGLANFLDRTPFDVVNVGQFYLAMLEKLLRDPYIATSYVLLTVSTLLSSFLTEEMGKHRSSITAPLLLSIAPLYSAHLPPLELGRYVLTTVAASGLASLITSPSVYRPKRISLRARAPLLRGRTKTRGEDLFEDLRPFVKLLGEVCLQGKYRYVLILGLSLEDERAFLKYVLGADKCAAKILLFHEYGRIPPELNPESTLVFYIPPLSSEEAADLLSRLSGYPREIIESLDPEYFNMLKYFDRVSLLKIAERADSLVARGSPAKRAFKDAISETLPMLTPEMASLIERIASLYPVIGFKRDPFKPLSDKNNSWQG